MLTFSRFVNEVAEPLAGDEKKFKAKHVFVKHKELAGEPTKDDKVFNATNVKKTKRIADQETNESVKENTEQVVEDNEVVDPNPMATDATEFSDPKPEIAVAAAKMPEEELKKVLNVEETKHTSMSSSIRKILGK